MTNNQVVHYLESPEYEYSQRPQGIRGGLVGIKIDDYATAQHLKRLGPYLHRFWDTVGGSPSDHADRLCNSTVALCTGEGFRWKPGDPVARFP
jgi:hypothetical protein